MDHFKDCIRLVPGNGGTGRADHAAMRPVTPYDSLAWTTAVAIVRERMEGAKKNMVAFDSQEHAPISEYFYLMGRYEAYRDLRQEMEERGKP